MAVHFNATAIKAKNIIDFYLLLLATLLMLFNACTIVKHNGDKCLMNAVRFSVLTLRNRCKTDKTAILKYLRNYYLRKFSTIVREKKGTMKNTFFQAHLDLVLFELPE